MGETARLTPSATVVRGAPPSADLDGELVLMSVEAGRYYGLDAIGGEIWSLLERPIRVEALCADLAARYDAEPGIIARDVLNLLDQLLAHDLIKADPITADSITADSITAET